jgi:hypothetical protein
LFYVKQYLSLFARTLCSLLKADIYFFSFQAIVKKEENKLRKNKKEREKKRKRSMTSEGDGSI